MPPLIQGHAESTPPRKVKKHQAPNLQTDEETDAIWAAILTGLKTARLDAGHTQAWVAKLLSERTGAISEWETGAVDPSLDSLNRWCRRLDRRLVLVRPGSELRYKSPLPMQDGERWEVYERRRLALPLAARRQDLDMSQERLAGIVGVGRCSIQRWETVQVPPRPVSLVVWAQKLDYHLVLRPFEHGKSHPQLIRPPRPTNPVATRPARPGSPGRPTRPVYPVQRG